LTAYKLNKLIACYVTSNGGVATLDLSAESNEMQKVNYPQFAGLRLLLVLFHLIFGGRI